MSIPVEPEDLAATLTDFGAGYLLTTSADRQVKAVTVEPRLEGPVLRVTGPGRGSVANAREQPRVTLLFPPRQVHGYTLLVDGRADVDGTDVVVTPASAVLHRPAAHADGPPAPASVAGTDSACGNDCAHL